MDVRIRKIKGIHYILKKSPLLKKNQLYSIIIDIQRTTHI